MGLENERINVVASIVTDVFLSLDLHILVSYPF